LYRWYRNFRKPTNRYDNPKNFTDVQNTIISQFEEIPLNSPRFTNKEIQCSIESGLNCQRFEMSKPQSLTSEHYNYFAKALKSDLHKNSSKSDANLYPKRLIKVCPTYHSFDHGLDAMDEEDSESPLMTPKPDNSDNVNSIAVDVEVHSEM